MKKGIVKLGRKEYATWPVVLDEAHKKGLISIKTKLVQVPTKDNDNVAIVKAIVQIIPEKFIEIPDGEKVKITKEFEAYGDVSPENTVGNISTALIRMAETRAKGRALRDAVNIGLTLEEELPEKPVKKNPDFSKKLENVAECDGCEVPIPQIVVDYSQEHFNGKKYCRVCQDEKADEKVI